MKISALDEQGKIWFDGQFVDWKDATVHVMSHVLHYGSSVFEGLRCYETPQGPAIFRLNDHLRRIFDSAKIYRMPLPYSQQQLFDATIELIRINKMKSAYLRPIAFRGYGEMGVDPSGSPVNMVIAALNWGKYLGDEAMEQGVDVCVSSWTRSAPNTMPAMAKAGSNYMNSQLIRFEANQHGYTEGIGLDVNGHVSEGSGENIFLVRDGVIYTPPFGDSVLCGLTRDCVIKIIDELGFELRETSIPREMMYIADELFFTGSAAEVSPIRSVDKIQIGAGRRGPITEKIQTRLFDYIECRREDKYGWLTFVK
ncbi:branched-chain amino acid transaminase [bacterium]|nr:branched-chain amino acid transaminase [bacterium]